MGYIKSIGSQTHEKASDCLPVVRRYVSWKWIKVPCKGCGEAVAVKEEWAHRKYGRIRCWDCKKKDQQELNAACVALALRKKEMGLIK